jgi:hypothetical protein
VTALEVGTLVAFTSLLAFVAGMGSTIAVFTALADRSSRSKRH